ncbi:MAG: WD40 repeat domain-containing protein, partial [Pseudomonadota bacterium]
VVSGSDDGTVRVWDASSGDSVRELRGHEGVVLSVALSADGGRVVSGSSDGTLRCFSGAGGRGAAAAADLACAWAAAVGSPHGIPSYASWRPGQDGDSDSLISASGDAWRFLSWDLEDPTEPSGWRRVPLQGYE